MSNDKRQANTKRTPTKRLADAEFLRTTVYIESNLKVWAQKAGDKKRMTLSDVVNHSLRCLQKYPKIEIEVDLSN